VHVAIIMDGNLAWAAQGGLTEKAAHVAATRAIREAVEVAARADVTTLTLYALSAGDWEPGFAEKISPLLRRYLLSEGSRMSVRLIFDCSSHDALVRSAMSQDPGSRPDPGEFRRSLEQLQDSTPLPGPVDLLIRTGCAGNFSDFMLWETAHADVVSMRLPWPDFDAALFEQALHEHGSRLGLFGSG
jgi:undecaprenyl diphosphate synthase